MRGRKKLMRLLVGVSVVCLVAGMTSAALAVDISIGGGVGLAPDYEGSDDYDVVPLPYGQARFDNGMYVELEGPTARANLIPSQTWRFGPMYNYRLSRSDVDNSKVDRLENVSDANEVGAFGGFMYNNLFVSLEFLTDAGDAHDGWYTTLRGEYTWVARDTLTLVFGASTTYASGSYMSTYFGVDAADSARSGLETYNADGDLKDVTFDLGVAYSFTENWGARFIGSYKRLVGDADADGPVTDEGRANQWFTGVLVVYSF